MIFFRRFAKSVKEAGISFSGAFTMAVASGSLYAIDRVSKNIVTAKMAERESFPVLEGFFHMTLVHNTGGAFGILKSHPYVFTAAALIFIFFAAGYVSLKWRSMLFREKTAICLLIGGTAGNLVDRIRFGYVIDFIDLRVWPVFNAADSFISIGAGILIFSLFFCSIKKET
ncbi:MAG: signal peptidase II [Candidatus Omnitrophota bacterium]